MFLSGEGYLEALHWERIGREDREAETGAILLAKLRRAKTASNHQLGREVRDRCPLDHWSPTFLHQGPFSVGRHFPQTKMGVGGMVTG